MTFSVLLEQGDSAAELALATFPAPPVLATPRHYLMCRPTYFTVRYAINAWMDPRVPVDRQRAVRQWEALREVYLALGHRVDVVEPVPGLPDMVFAANGALVVDGRVYGARFANRERAGEAPAHRNWFTSSGYLNVCEPRWVNEGEGDYAVVGDLLLAGTGFRTEVASHREAQEYFGRPVISLELIDPRFYHLDTALFVLDDENVAYYPAAFSPGSRAVLARLFPEAVLASRYDAEMLGLNSVSDGLNVVMPVEAVGLAEQLRERGYRPVPVDLSELRKAGGSVKCCTQELRG